VADTPLPQNDKEQVSAFSFTRIGMIDRTHITQGVT